MSETQVWLVTGATSGFGRAIVESALAAGHEVVAAVRRPEALGDLAERVMTVSLDVTDLAGMPSVVNEVMMRHGRVDVLVNNAGRGHLGAAEEGTDAELRALMDLHFFGPTELTRLLLPQMRARGSGTIVQMSSMGGRTTFPGVGAYSATKYALEGWSEALAAEVDPFGIRVIIVEPGAFRTGFNTSGALGSSSPLPAYRDQMDALKATFADQDGQQPGDPTKAAAAIVEAVASGRPPLHLVLGDDAVESINATLTQQQDELAAWESVSRSTAHD
ncbi:MAG TPA: oxidoreductase [Microlunatus sp.]|nr:oxidoreductase [Microlunatus sp.]